MNLWKMALLLPHTLLPTAVSEDPRSLQSTPDATTDNTTVFLKGKSPSDPILNRICIEDKDHLSKTATVNSNDTIDSSRQEVPAESLDTEEVSELNVTPAGDDSQVNARSESNTLADP